MKALVPEERKSKMVWAVHEGVRRVRAYECRNSLGEDQGVWWMPELGYSCHKDGMLFENREDAVKAAIVETKKHIKDTESLALRLNDRLKELESE